MSAPVQDDILRAENERLRAVNERLRAALYPFATIGIGTDPDYQPMIRMDRDAIVAARKALDGTP